MNKSKLISIFTAFKLPLIVLSGLIIFIILKLLNLNSLSLIVALISITLGSFELFKDVYNDLKSKNLALDYIAILAILVSLITGQFLVGIVIALMLSTGRTLEDYGANSAKRTLTKLAERIPHEVLVEIKNRTEIKSVSTIKKGETIIVRNGEVIPLDGIITSDSAIVDESSLTGEAYPVNKIKGDLVRSGTINLSIPIKITVTNDQENSSYTKIINIVKRAQSEKAPLVRLADKYSLWFTVITFVIASFAYLRLGTLESILAVLVVATPCPLILATPIALIGGMDKSAKKRVIIKKLSSIEVLSRVNTIVFDKTGTITLGKPVVTKFETIDKHNETEVLSIAAAIERNSLHPLAKSIVDFAQKKNIKKISSQSILETAGVGIKGFVNKKEYSLEKISDEKSPDMIIGMFENKKLIATFTLEDKVKKGTKEIVEKLKEKGLSLLIFSGDRNEVVKKLIEKLGIEIEYKAELKPSHKGNLIKKLQSEKNIVAMVGDGINDAPALALSNVGMVFSNEEQTAASEAADIVFLGGDFSSVIDSYQDAINTVKIAKQSIFWGIGLSVTAMILASFGLIPPIWGAILQEGIDVAVILNALRASK